MQPYYGDCIDNVICGDVIDRLKALPDESVNCIVTSPPYWGLRDYSDSTKRVWDGDAACEHKWGDMCPGHHPGQVPQTEGQIASGSEDAGCYCILCGAWHGQLGLEPTLEMFLGHMLAVTGELKRVLRKDGTLWWDHGDCYGGTSS